MKENWIVKWLAGIVWGGLVTCMLFMANYMWAESNNSRERDQNIKECHNEDMITLQKENNVKFEAIMCKLSTLDARQQVVLEKIKQIESNGK